MDLKLLLCMFLVYQHNFKVLHWKAKGHAFNYMHDLANTYYLKLETDADTIAEICISLGIDPVSYMECAETISSSEMKFLVLSANTDYEIETFLSNSILMFNNMIESMETLITPDSPIGVKVELENMIAYYYKQANFKLKRPSED